MCTIDLDERATVWRETFRTARKPHKCRCCFSPIAPGDRYMEHFSVFDRGSRATYEKACVPCATIIERFATEHDGIRFSPSSIGDMLSECAEYAYPDEDDLSDTEREPLDEWGEALNAIHARYEAAKADRAAVPA